MEGNGMSDPRTWRPRQFSAADGAAPGEPSGLLKYLDELDVDALLLEHRALVFRGFDITEETFERVSTALLRRREAYVHGNSPRTKVGDNIYTSTEFPPEYDISMHNELSYAHVWPSRLLFCCTRPAATGGATPVLHGGLWLDSLGAEIRAAFRDGVCYRQYLHGGMGLGKSWQDTFETTDPTMVDGYLEASDAAWEWTSSGGLKVSQVRPAIIAHPVTGEQVWFSQMDQWHSATLGEETMRELAAIVPEDEMPQSVTFPDGSAIPDEFAVTVRQKGLALAVDVDWRAGDVLLIDNVAVAHGRRSFTGSRRVLVGMSM
jgi:alpha-ketoglutarate-dependent taurine dioxygenase